MNPAYNKILSLLSEIKSNIGPNGESDNPDPMNFLKKAKPSHSVKAPRPTRHSTPKSTTQPRPELGPDTPENKAPRRPPTDRGGRT